MSDTIGNIVLSGVVCLCSGPSQVDTATVTASINPSPAVKGATRGHIVRCDFSVATGDTFQAMNLYQTRGSGDQLIAVIFANGGSPLWDQNAPQDLRQRGTLDGSKQLGILSLATNDTLCSDLGQSYKCDLQWSAASTAKSSNDTAIVALEGAVFWQFILCCRDPKTVQKYVQGSDNFAWGDWLLLFYVQLHVTSVTPGRSVACYQCYPRPCVKVAARCKTFFNLHS